MEKEVIVEVTNPGDGDADDATMDLKFGNVATSLADDVGDVEDLSVGVVGPVVEAGSSSNDVVPGVLGSEVGEADKKGFGVVNFI